MRDGVDSRLEIQQKEEEERSSRVWWVLEYNDNRLKIGKNGDNV